MSKTYGFFERKAPIFREAGAWCYGARGILWPHRPCAQRQGGGVFNDLKKLGPGMVPLFQKFPKVPIQRARDLGIFGRFASSCQLQAFSQYPKLYVLINVLVYYYSICNPHLAIGILFFWTALHIRLNLNGLHWISHHQLYNVHTSLLVISTVSMDIIEMVLSACTCFDTVELCCVCWCYINAEQHYI